MQISRRKFIAAVTLALFSAGAAAVCAQERFDTEPLTIIHADGKSSQFTVELALTSPQKQQGLMYRKSMAPDHGMLFDFQENRLVSMWMRHTYIPLDMVFMAQTGRITHIYEGAVPHDESIISSRGSVYFVLELNAGAAKRYNIKVGDLVSSAQIKKAAQ